MSSWRVGAVSLTVAILLASAWASGWHRFTWGARFGTFGCALAVLGVGLFWRHRQPNARSSGSDGTAPLPVVNHTGAALWLVVILVKPRNARGLLEKTGCDRIHRRRERETCEV